MDDRPRLYDFDPRNLPPDLLKAIRLMAASVALTERIVEEATAKCTAGDAAHGITSAGNMAMPLRYGILRSAVETRLDDRDALKKLDELIGRIDEGFKRRNAVLHHAWCRDRATNEIFIVKGSAPVPLEAALFPISVEAINRDTLFIYQAGVALMTFLRTHNLAPSLSRRPGGMKSKALTGFLRAHKRPSRAPRRAKRRKSSRASS